MPDPAERFIKAATSPLGDNAELQIAARHELAEAMEEAGEGPGDSLDTAAARLEAVDRNPRGKWWRYGLYAITAIISAALLAASVSSFALFRQTMQVVSAFGGMPGWASGGEEDVMEKRLSKNLSPAQKLLLLGDTRRSGKADRFAALWESDPENPAYYAGYGTAYLSENNKLPPDFMETARRLDPENGWFAIIAASEAAKQSIDAKAPAAKSPGGVKIKAIKDTAKLDEALTLLHEASKAKHIDSHQLALIKQRIPLLPARTDSLDQLVPMMYMATLTVPNMRFRYLADAVSAKAIQLAADKDAEGFKRLLADWEAFTATYVHSEDSSLVDALVAVATIRGPLKAMSEAAADLGIAEDAARLKALDDRIEAWRASNKSRIDPNADLAMHSGTLAGLALPAVSKQSMKSPVLTDEDLKPGRLADYALIDRIMSWIGWLVLGLAALASGLYRHRCGVLTQRLSGRLACLLRPVDWVWILGAGVVLPVVYYLVISRVLPLGGRDWSLKASLFTVPAGQFSSMVWLMIVLPLVIARRRLAVRGGAVGLSGGRQIFGWIAVVSGLLALPAFGLTFYQAKPSEGVMIAAGFLLGVLQIYALFAGIRALFSKQAALLRRATISRILASVHVAAMLVMMAALLYFHAEEKHWIANDRLMDITVETPSINRFEYEVTQAMKQELLELMAEPR